VKIVPTGRKNPASSGCQVLFLEAVVTGYQDRAAECPEPLEVNRVLPMPPEVIELMKQAPPNGLILDCGGGDRILADPRYVNIEYAQCQLPAVYGDAMKLPFQTGVFDLVFSQALLEHVPSPLTAVEEMRRVTRPGGILWSGMAFMQPVHAVPSHYFNATTWGIQELFKSLEILDVSWFGELSVTIDWLFKEAGIAEQMDRGEYDALLSRIRALDPLVSHEALRAVASGVAVHARKPVEPR
jgi:SAM-dependent methyltransferase